MADPMTPERLRELEALCEAATPGPWEVEREELPPDYSDEEQALAWPERIGPIYMAEHHSPLPEKAEADVRFIAAARQALPDLLAYVHQLETELDDAQVGLMRCREESARLMRIVTADSEESRRARAAILGALASLPEKPSP